ncbi:MAG: hypothetical protein BWY76_01049 [bacterium ADurb.Bin429]|nr:MAG: hypothetical protein BWY76_01049 [bacterium ADurb.Bin429]
MPVEQRHVVVIAEYVAIHRHDSFQHVALLSGQVLGSEQAVYPHQIAAHRQPAMPVMSVVRVNAVAFDKVAQQSPGVDDQIIILISDRLDQHVGRYLADRLPLEILLEDNIGLRNAGKCTRYDNIIQVDFPLPSLRRAGLEKERVMAGTVRGVAYLAHLPPRGLDAQGNLAILVADHLDMVPGTGGHRPLFPRLPFKLWFGQVRAARGQGNPPVAQHQGWGVSAVNHDIEGE